METIKHKVDQQKFDELIQKDKPTLVDMIISLQRQLYTLKTTVYGAKCKSEKTPQELMELSGQMEFAFFTEEEKKATEEKLSQIEAEEAQRTTVVKEHLRKNRSYTDTDISELPVETIVLEPEGINDKNREDYVLIGTETTKTIAVRPRQVYILETVRNKYVLKSQLQYQGADQPTFLIAPAPVSVIPAHLQSSVGGMGT